MVVIIRRIIQIIYALQYIYIIQQLLLQRTTVHNKFETYFNQCVIVQAIKFITSYIYEIIIIYNHNLSDNVVFICYMDEMRDMIMTLIFLIFSQLLNKIHLFNLNTSNVTIILLLQIYTNVYF